MNESKEQIRKLRGDIDCYALEFNVTPMYILDSLRLLLRVHANPANANIDTNKKEEKKEEDFASVVAEESGSQYLTGAELVQLTRMKIRVAVAIEHMLLATIELEKA